MSSVDFEKLKLIMIFRKIQIQQFLNDYYKTNPKTE